MEGRTITHVSESASGFARSLRRSLSPCILYDRSGPGFRPHRKIKLAVSRYGRALSHPICGNLIPRSPESGCGSASGASRVLGERARTRPDPTRSDLFRRVQTIRSRITNPVTYRANFRLPCEMILLKPEPSPVSSGEEPYPSSTCLRRFNAPRPHTLTRGGANVAARVGPRLRKIFSSP